MDARKESDAMAIDADITESQVRRKGRGFKAPVSSEANGGGNGMDLDKKEGIEYERLLDDETTRTKEITAGNAARSVEGWVVIVTGVHEEATEEDLQDKFADYGNVMNLVMPLDRRTGYVKGYALVEYETRKEAENAIRQASGRLLLDQELQCDFAFVRAPTGLSGVASSTMKSRRRSQSPPKRPLVNRID